MKQLIIASVLIATCVALPLEQQLPHEDASASTVTDLEAQQNENAQYEFESDIVDHINDLTIKRYEQREGLRTKGAYAYSDGFFKRTVHYVADENGFRVVKEENEALPGPKVDLNGVASIANKAHGTELKYTVKSVPVKDTHVFE